MSEEKRPEWMNSISGIVNTDDYLLGRKIDKTYELAQQEKADKARELRTNLIASDKIKLVGDPILDLERRREELKLEIINNPIRLRRLRERLLEEDRIRNLRKSSPRPNDAPESPNHVNGTRDTKRRSLCRDRDSSPSSSSESPSSTTTSSSRDSRSHRLSRHSRSKRHKHKRHSSSRERHTKRHKHYHRDDDSRRKDRTGDRQSDFSERRKKSHHKHKHGRHSSRSPHRARRERDRR